MNGNGDGLSVEEAALRGQKKQGKNNPYLHRRASGQIYYVQARWGTDGTKELLRADGDGP